MKENPLDKELRDRLEKRRVQPSEDAWQRLEQRLDVSPIEKTNHLKLWYGVAASVVVLVLAGTAFFVRVNEVELPKVVVDQPVNSEIKNELKEEVTQHPEPVQNSLTETVAETKKPETARTHRIIPAGDINKETATEVATVEIPVQDETTGLSFEEKKALEVAAEIRELQQKGEVSDSEVEALLEKARREIEVERLLQNGNKVDAMALLQTVEDELDQSFKEKVYEALKEGLEKVKTAVANRNQ